MPQLYLYDKKGKLSLDGITAHGLHGKRGSTRKRMYLIKNFFPCGSAFSVYSVCGKYYLE